jgi:hypothetical protein
VSSQRSSPAENSSVRVASAGARGCSPWSRPGGLAELQTSLASGCQKKANCKDWWPQRLWPDPNSHYQFCNTSTAFGSHHQFHQFAPFRPPKTKAFATMSAHYTTPSKARLRGTVAYLKAYHIPYFKTDSFAEFGF